MSTKLTFEEAQALRPTLEGLQELLAEQTKAYQAALADHLAVGVEEETFRRGVLAGLDRIEARKAGAKVRDRRALRGR